MTARTVSDGRIPWWDTLLGEEEITSITEAVRARRITQGAITEELEGKLAAFLGVPHVVLTANGGLALAAALIASGVGPGDEVVIPALSFVATAHAPMLLGARVRFVDVESSRPLMDIGGIEQVLTMNTKAIVPVHLNGRAADIAGALRIADGAGLEVVEDACQALGSRNDRGCLGTEAGIGCFSTGISKLITTGEGGSIALRDLTICERLKRIRNNGVLALENGGFQSFGFNFRQTDLQAAMGIAQFGKIEARIASLKDLYMRYQRELQFIPFVKLIEVDIETGELPLWIEIVCPRRDAVIGALWRRGIQARAFPPALCDSPHLAASGAYPRAQYFASHGLILPSGPDQASDSLMRTTRALEEVGEELGLRESPEPCP